MLYAYYDTIVTRGLWSYRCHQVVVPRLPKRHYALKMLIYRRRHQTAQLYIVVQPQERKFRTNIKGGFA
jgi:hypothetical protein